MLFCCVLKHLFCSALGDMELLLRQIIIICCCCCCCSCCCCCFLILLVCLRCGAFVICHCFLPLLFSPSLCHFIFLLVCVSYSLVLSFCLYLSLSLSVCLILSLSLSLFLSLSLSLSFCLSLSLSPADNELVRSASFKGHKLSTPALTARPASQHRSPGEQACGMPGIPLGFCTRSGSSPAQPVFWHPPSPALVFAPGGWRTWIVSQVAGRPCCSITKRTRP